MSDSKPRPPQLAFIDPFLLQAKNKPDDRRVRLSAFFPRATDSSPTQYLIAAESEFERLLASDRSAI